MEWTPFCCAPLHETDCVAELFVMKPTEEGQLSTSTVYLQR